MTTSDTASVEALEKARAIASAKLAEARVELAEAVNRGVELKNVKDLGCTIIYVECWRDVVRCLGAEV